MWRNLFLLIFVILQVRGALRLGDVGVCKRGRRMQPACCANWKYERAKGVCVPVCNFGCGDGRCIEPNTCTCEPPLTYRNKKCEQPKCNLPYCTNPNCSYNDGYEKECKCSDGYEYKGDYNCVPKCTGGCVNGNCVAPDICSCLEGYRNVSALKCDPICSSCENGECTAPNQCSCNAGYVKKEDRCIPVCRDCENGKCVAPERCECNEGYQKDKNGKCTPICNNCKNGDCVAPGHCQCKDGYEKRDDRCSPICSNCTNGVCTAPGVCLCNKNYRRFEDECAPDCDKPCVNGFCSAPNSCTCNRGYQKDVSDGSCQPTCTNECVNATCVGPDECKCLDGYIKSNEFVCKPKCACENGRCIGSDGTMTCMCNDGYNMVKGSCRPVCRNKCVNGFCVEPDVCACDDEYSSNSTHPWICAKPCVSCHNGECNTHGQCICHPGFEYINNTCTPVVVDCATCEKQATCNDTGCWCNDSRRCEQTETLDLKNTEPTSTGLAGLQILWLGGAIGSIVLVTTVIFVFRHMWKRQQEMRAKEKSTDTYPYGSVAYTVAGTLQSTTEAASVPNLYSEDNDYEDEDEGEGNEAANGLLTDDLDKDV